MTMSVTQQEPMTLPAIERRVAQLEEQRAAAMADHAQALRRADGETMMAARCRLEELTRRRDALLATRIHARAREAMVKTTRFYTAFTPCFVRAAGVARRWVGPENCPKTRPVSSRSGSTGPFFRWKPHETRFLPRKTRCNPTNSRRKAG